MAEKGIVTEIKDNLAIVKMKRIEACGKCKACVAGLSEQEMIMEAENQCGAQVGDWVELELADNGFLFAVVVMYGIPLVAFMVGLCLSYFVLLPNILPNVNPDLPSFIVALVFTGLSYLWIKSQELRWKGKRYRPIAKRIATAD